MGGCGGSGMTMTVGGLLADYRAGRLDPEQVARDVCGRLARYDGAAWITRVDDDRLLAAARDLGEDDRGLLLYGVPFAVKDNIDVAGLPTTAGCPGFAYVPEETAPVVARLQAAGALLVGKTNMDQFATGLVGTRSPYGVPASVFDDSRVSGGSSSGSAVAVALGQVAFALGTDTAGSGRVPAAFNELVGCKPTRGLLSTRGVVPACRSLDCVSILARDPADAGAVLKVASGFDAGDPWSRAEETPITPRHGKIALPHDEQLLFEDAHAARAWEEACTLAAQRWDVVRADIAPLLDAAQLLYDVWVAERTVALGDVIAAQPAGLDPTVAGIVTSGATRSAIDVFTGEHALAQLRRAAAPIWEGADALLLPTTPGHPRIADAAADPVGVNTALGQFTNFVNLMDMAALAVPGPRRDDGLPAGVTLVAPAFHDRRLLELAGEWRGEAVPHGASGTKRLIVAGAHMSGLPLNGELTGRGARLVARTRTAASYRLVALPGAGVPRPGLIRVGSGGTSVEVEVWELAPAAIGELLAGVPAPLGIGRVALADGEEALGFVCEAFALSTAQDISHHGGWRAYLASQEQAA